MSTFYLVRHAHADWTPNKARSLSKQGCRDAERVADILQSYPVQLIYASPFRKVHYQISF
jgi:phosphohistidine phosphatase SixA